MEKIKDIFLKDSTKTSFNIALPSGEQIEVVVEGSPEATTFFKEKTVKFFADGAEQMRHTNQKLTEDQVREIKKIRREKGWGRTRLSRKFKVGKTTIERILNGETWKDVE